jgi:hypothetical protein
MNVVNGWGIMLSFVSERKIVKDECSGWMEHMVHPWKPASETK